MGYTFTPSHGKQLPILTIDNTTIPAVLTTHLC